MSKDQSPQQSRRRFLGRAVAVPAALVMASVAASSRGRAVAACGPGGPTPAQTEGPYFKANAPQRASLIEPGMPGARLVVTGVVTGPDCRPIADARVDFWQADDAGRYDNRGYRLRGHVVTDEAGRYRVETIVPGGYPGRTPHIHVKIQARGRRPLTTQLYFPDEPLNRRDGIFDPALVMRVRERDGGGKEGSFDFVLT